MAKRVKKNMQVVGLVLPLDVIAKLDAVAELAGVDRDTACSVLVAFIFYKDKPSSGKTEVQK